MTMMKCKEGVLDSVLPHSKVYAEKSLFTAKFARTKGDHDLLESVWGRGIRLVVKCGVVAQ